ncbi:MAG: Pertussis toxin liberation protein [Pseudomonadota bacterium]|jgi:pilus assembly protein CpaF
MLNITIEHPDHATRSLNIVSLPCRIGRAALCEVSLPGWRVAKRHAELRDVAGGLQLEDAGSITGTVVNGQRIDRFGPVTAADLIDIGGFRLTVRKMPAPPLQADSFVSPAVYPDRHAHFSSGDPFIRPEQPAQHLTPEPNPLSARQQAQEFIRYADSPGHFERPTSLDRGESRGSGDANGASGVNTIGPMAHNILMQSWSERLQRETLRAMDLRRQDLSRHNDTELRTQVAELVRQLIAASDGFPSSLDEQQLVREVVDAALGLGPLDALLADPSITEIMINGPAEIWVERQGRLQRSPLRFQGESDLRRVLDRIVTPLGRRIDEGSPMVDARLPDGSRVNAVLAPLSLRGSALTIRRFTRSLMSIQDLVDRGSASAAMLEFLSVCVASRRNIIISGGTGSGKTTLLNLLSNLIPPGERVLTIEDSAELSLRGDHVLSLEARPPNLEQRGEITIRDLVRNALRMRPDRIVVGECRGAEALDMLQAMNTGHDGSLTTLHANSARDVTSRLEVLVLMAGMDLPVLALREQIASAIDLIVHQARFADGRRRITTIAEVTGTESGRIQMQTLFEYQPDLGFVACDVVPQFYEKLARTGASLDLSIFSSRAR